MIARRLRSSLAATSFLLLLAAGSNAGQRRVDVGSGGLAFGPQDQTLNLGDHVTWIWVGAGHNVENGVSLSDPNQGTIFNTAVGGSTAAFTWKADLLVPPWDSAQRTGTADRSALGPARRTGGPTGAISDGCRPFSQVEL